MYNIILILVSWAPFIYVLIDLKKRRQAIELLYRFRDMFEHIAFILKSSPIELKQLFKSVSYMSSLSIFCKNVADSLDSGMSFKHSWNEAIVTPEICILTKTERAYLCTFADVFGRGCVEDQLYICKKYIDYCNETAIKKKEKLEKDNKFNMSSSLLLGAVIFVFFF